MASAGQKIRNPVTGENITFLETAADTDGRILRLEMVTDPGSGGAAEHLHPRSTERYDVREGELHVWLGDDEHVLGQGTKLEIPPRTRHRFATPDDRPARVLCEFEPAGRFEYFMETVYRLAEEGKTNAGGTPKSFLQAAVIGHAYVNDIALPRIPVFLQRLLFAVLAPIGRLFGYGA